MRHALNHRHAEYRALMTVVLAVCGLAALGSVVPVVDDIVNAGTAGLVALIVLAGLVRLGVRWVRERLEDRADARIAAAWQARHAPHLLATQMGRPARTVVA